MHHLTRAVRTNEKPEVINTGSFKTVIFTTTGSAYSEGSI